MCLDGRHTDIMIPRAVASLVIPWHYNMHFGGVITPIMIQQQNNAAVSSSLRYLESTVAAYLVTHIPVVDA